MRLHDAGGWKVWGKTAPTPHTKLDSADLVIASCMLMGTSLSVRKEKRNFSAADRWLKRNVLLWLFRTVSALAERSSSIPGTAEPLRFNQPPTRRTRPTSARGLETPGEDGQPQLLPLSSFAPQAYGAMRQQLCVVRCDWLAFRISPLKTNMPPHLQYRISHISRCLLALAFGEYVYWWSAATSWSKTSRRVLCTPVPGVAKLYPTMFCSKRWPFRHQYIYWTSCRKGLRIATVSTPCQASCPALLFFISPCLVVTNLLSKSVAWFLPLSLRAFPLSLR